MPYLNSMLPLLYFKIASAGGWFLTSPKYYSKLVFSIQRGLFIERRQQTNLYHFKPCPNSRLEKFASEDLVFSSRCPNPYLIQSLDLIASEGINMQARKQKQRNATYLEIFGFDLMADEWFCVGFSTTKHIIDFGVSGSIMRILLKNKRHQGQGRESGRTKKNERDIW